MIYLLTLPGRMLRAAIAIPLGDVDQALCLSAATRYIDSWADAFQSLKEAS